jgi:hypothetical protein
MPPDASVPSVPNGYVAVSPRAYQGYHPTAKELVAAPAAMADLERFVDYTAAFGSLVPSPEAITAALTSGVAWRALLGPSNEWNEYVKGQNGMAWKYALTLLDELKPAFLTAVAKNRALAQKYPGLYALLEAPREVAKQGLATKKKNGKTKAVATASAAQAAETSVAAPVAATPVRTVTVSG